MAEMEERELLLRSLKGYLVDLADSGVDDLVFATGTVTAPPLAAASSGASVAPAAAAAQAQAQAQTAIPAAAASAESAVSAAAPVASAAAVSSPAQDVEVPCRQEGNPQARLLFLMAGPGYGGAAGDLLAKIIGAMKFTTDQVCLLSFDAEGDVAGVAAGVIKRIETVAPEAVVALGEEATALLLGGSASLERVRGKWHDVRGRAVMPTLHPELLLEDEGLKRHVWEDMKLVMRRLAGAA